LLLVTRRKQTMMMDGQLCVRAGARKKHRPCQKIMATGSLKNPRAEGQWVTNAAFSEATAALALAPAASGD